MWRSYYPLSIDLSPDNMLRDESKVVAVLWFPEVLHEETQHTDNHGVRCRPCPERLAQHLAKSARCWDRGGFVINLFQWREQGHRDLDAFLHGRYKPRTRSMNFNLPTRKVPSTPLDAGYSSVTLHMQTVSSPLVIACDLPPQLKTGKQLIRYQADEEKKGCMCYLPLCCTSHSTLVRLDGAKSFLLPLLCENETMGL